MRRLLCVFGGLCLILVASSACKKKNNKGPDNIDDVPVTETITIDGLSEPVSVVRDELYRPHIYAANETDLFRVFGYIQAQDRFVQMDFQRRLPTGRLAELAGGLSASLVDLDFANRQLGLNQVIQDMIDGLDTSSSLYLNAQAYTAGVNDYLADLKAGDHPPPLELGFVNYPISEIPDWTLNDSFAVGRLLAMDLSWDEDQKVGILSRIQAVETAFNGTIYEGMICDVVLQYNAVTDGSIVDPSAPRSAPGACPFTNVAFAPVTARQRSAVENLTTTLLKNPYNTAWAPDRGSNNWIAGPSVTTTGHPILANDPHLGLSIPSVWHQVHLNTTRAGGDLDVIGVAFPGAPAVLIGHNGRVAWGVTNVGPDVSDNYVETYSVGTGTNGVDQVMWDDDGSGPNAPALVDLVERQETVQVRDGASVTEQTQTFLDLPHRPGAIIPGTYDAGTGTAISWRWIGFDTFNDLQFFDGMSRASNQDDVIANINANNGIPSAPQNVVWVTADGDIGYKANGRYPIRDDDDGDPYTDPPFLPLPGDGLHEWIGYVDEADVPQRVNPSTGFHQTANQDPLGNTLDGDPLNDATPYIGFNWDFGPRGFRINERLAEEAAGDGISVEDMMAIQADHKSPLGARMTPFILSAIEGNSQYTQAYDLLKGWGDRGYNADSGAGPNEIQQNEIANASATALFNAWLVEFQSLVLDDELAAAGIGMGSQERAGLLLQMLEDPQSLNTYDGTYGDCILFDDMDTAGTQETRDDMIIAGLDAALAFLPTTAGYGTTDPNGWLWGSKHTLTLSNNVSSTLDRPTQSDPNYPNGFPKHGDNYVVDASNFGITNHGYTFGSGPSVRVVTDATPDKFRLMMGFPGGVSGDPTSEHYDDQVFDHYIFNEYREFWYYEKDVAKNGQERIIFQP